MLGVGRDLCGSSSPTPGMADGLPEVTAGSAASPPLLTPRLRAQSPGAVLVLHGEAGALSLKDLRDKICTTVKSEIRSGLPCFTQQSQSGGRWGKRKAIFWIQAKLSGVSGTSPSDFHTCGLRASFTSPCCPPLGPVSFHPNRPQPHGHSQSTHIFYCIFFHFCSHDSPRKASRQKYGQSLNSTSCMPVYIAQTAPSLSRRAARGQGTGGTRAAYGVHTHTVMLARVWQTPERWLATLLQLHFRTDIRHPQINSQTSPSLPTQRLGALKTYLRMSFSSLVLV